MILVSMRREREALDVITQALKLDPVSYAAMGRFDEAIAELECAAATSPNNPRSAMALGHAYGAAGRTHETRAILEDLLRRRSEQECVFPDYVASVYAGLGDAEGAFVWLTKAYDERSGRLVVLHVDPMFRALHSDARFTELLRNVGLPPRKV